MNTFLEITVTKNKDEKDDRRKDMTKEERYDMRKDMRVVAPRRLWRVNTSSSHYRYYRSFLGLGTQFAYYAGDNRQLFSSGFTSFAVLTHFHHYWIVLVSFIERTLPCQ